MTALFLNLKRIDDFIGFVILSEAEGEVEESQFQIKLYSFEYKNEL